MHILNNPSMFRAIIMDHYEHPRHQGTTSDPTYETIHMDSASCIDDIYLQIKIEDDKIVDVLWRGVACAISTASTSIMTELILGASVSKAREIMDNFNKMMNEEEFDEEILGEAIAFINTSKQASRIKCATISWRGLEEIFESEETKNGK